MTDDWGLLPHIYAMAAAQMERELIARGVSQEAAHQQALDTTLRQARELLNVWDDIDKRPRTRRMKGGAS